MRKADQVHGLSGLMVLLLLMGATLTGLAIAHRFTEAKAGNSRVLVKLVLNADINEVPAFVAAMRDHRPSVDPALKQEYKPVGGLTPTATGQPRPPSRRCYPG